MSRRLAHTSTALLVLFAAVLGIGLSAGAASADSAVDQAVAALNAGATVYNDPSAQRVLTATQVATLTTQAQNAGTPIYAVIVPESTRGAYGDQAGVLRALLAAGPKGTYAVIAGFQCYSIIDDIEGPDIQDVDLIIYFQSADFNVRFVR